MQTDDKTDRLILSLTYNGVTHHLTTERPDLLAGALEVVKKSTGGADAQTWAEVLALGLDHLRQYGKDHPIPVEALGKAKPKAKPAKPAKPKAKAKPKAATAAPTNGAGSFRSQMLAFLNEQPGPRSREAMKKAFPDHNGKQINNVLQGLRKSELARGLGRGLWESV